MNQPSDPLPPRDLCRTGRRGRIRAVIIAFGLGGVMLIAVLTATALGCFERSCFDERWTTRSADGVSLSLSKATPAQFAPTPAPPPSRGREVVQFRRGAPIHAP